MIIDQMGVGDRIGLDWWLYLHTIRLDLYSLLPIFLNLTYPSSTYLPTYQLLLRCREANERILAKVSERERRESNPYFVLYYYEYNYVKLLRII